MKKLSPKELSEICQKLQAFKEGREFSYLSDDQAVEMLKRFNLKVVYPSEQKDVEYENLKMIQDEPEILIHNMNHFRVASPDRRLKAEFGLGSPPNSNTVNYHHKPPLESTVLGDLCELEENIVLVLDLICAHLHSYRLSRINVPIDRKFEESLQNLYMMGLIDNNGNLDEDKLRPEGYELFFQSNW